MRIDVHIHAGASWYGWNHNKLKAADLVKLYEKYGVDKGCLSSWEVAYDFEHGNQEVAQICKEFPDVFIPFVIIAPRDGAEAVEMLQRYVEDYGFKGAKMHPSCNRFNASLKWMMDPIMEKCKEYKIPVLFHSENNQYCNPNVLGQLAKRHPDVNIIIAHMGDEGGGGYLDAIEAAKDNKNIYLDTTGVINEVFILPTAIRQLGADRIVWGSDLPICNIKMELDKVLTSDDYDPSITQEDKDKILGLNMQRILGL